ncbi:MAG: FkbM family methyltransferase [Alphaproteobacteria bacterium]
MLAEIDKLAPRLSYGQDGDTPWIELEGGPRFHGFATEKANLEVFHLLRGDLPAAIPKTHFRLVKDCLNRYVYPHMRPDLKPIGYAVEAMFGFHGQHKDAIADQPPETHAALNEAFRPKRGEIFIDCGAFLGFGELRIAPEIGDGHLYAIEASAACHALLQRNMTHNRIGNVTALHRAAWKEATELELETTEAQGNSLIGEVQKGVRKERVRTVSIDGLVEEFRLQRLDMLSLTLNGAEVEALEGAAHALRVLRPRIRLAGWYTRGGEKIWRLTKAHIEPHGYRVFVGPRGNVMALPQERVAHLP